jgi:hypothetical protein
LELQPYRLLELLYLDKEDFLSHSQQLVALVHRIKFIGITVQLSLL